MKAAVIRQSGQTPVYGDFQEPSATAGEQRIAVVAAALSPVVKSRAAGSHYSAPGDFPLVAGIDGVGRLDDGRRVYFILPRAPFGSMAEQTVVPASHCIAVPEALDDITAAAIANPGLSSWAGLKERARFAPGETVLINGATGTSGTLAVQIAKYLGAKKVIATGRNETALQSLKTLGADDTVRLGDDTKALDAALTQHFANGVDVVLDFLWGPSAERILGAITKTVKEGVRLRFVQLGNASGTHINLAASILRSVAIEMMGSGIGSVPMSRIVGTIDEVMQAAAKAKFQFAIRTVPLAEVEQAWQASALAPRVVFTMGNAG